MGPVSPLFCFLSHPSSYHSFPDPMCCSKGVFSQFLETLSFFLLQDLLPGVLFWHWTLFSTWSSQLKCHQLETAFPTSLSEAGHSYYLLLQHAFSFFSLALSTIFNFICSLTYLIPICYTRLWIRGGHHVCFVLHFLSSIQASAWHIIGSQQITMGWPNGWMSEYKTLCCWNHI